MVKIIAKNHQELKEKYLGFNIDGMIDKKIKYFTIKPFKDKEKIIWIDEIKEFLILINEDFIEEKKEVIEKKEEIVEQETDDDPDYMERKELKWKFLELITGEKKKWSDATELLVNYILEKNYIYTTKEDNKNETWIYRDGVYIPHGKSEIKMILRDILDCVYSHYIYGLVLNKIEVDTFIEVNEFFKERYLEEIPVQNGILNIYTREIKPFTPEKIFFNKMPVKYDPKEKCNLIEQFLNDILPVEEDKNVFFEIGGFCLMNEYKYEKSFMFVGNGRNGKDKSLELLKRLIGVENCSAIPLQQLNDDFSIAELFGKKINLAGDISNQDLKDTSMFKALTGRSLISAKRKFLSNVVFVNKAKFIFACNDLPMVYDVSRGFWDRWILLQFPYTFVTQEELDKQKENKFFKLKDDDIINKITTEEELSGLLNLFLDGLDRLNKNKRFSQTAGTDEIKNFWIRKSNSFMAFCYDNLEEDYENRITKKNLKKKYIAYCKKHKVTPKSAYVVKRVLEETFGVEEGYDGTDRYWEGIKFKIAGLS